MSVTISFEVPSSEAAFFLAAFGGREALSQLFELEVDVLAQDGLLADADVDALLGKTGRIALDGQEEVLQGMIRAVELLPLGISLDDASALETLTPKYRITLVPRAWVLTQSSGSRAYYDLTVLEVVKPRLEQGFDYARLEWGSGGPGGIEPATPGEP